MVCDDDTQEVQPLPHVDNLWPDHHRHVSEPAPLALAFGFSLNHATPNDVKCVLDLCSWAKDRRDFIKLLNTYEGEGATRMEETANPMSGTGMGIDSGVRLPTQATAPAPAIHFRMDAAPAVANQMLMVAVPVGAQPGQIIAINTPSGQVLQVQVPAGLQVGQQFQVQV
jgi:hypothetical protein